MSQTRVPRVLDRYDIDHVGTHWHNWKVQEIYIGLLRGVNWKIRIALGKFTWQLIWR